MDQVFLKTRELGQALLESECYQTMKAAEEKAMANAQAADIMGEYLSKRTELQSMLSQENPDSVVMKRVSDEMDALQEKLQMMDDVVALTEARGAFSQLINQVNQVLQFIVTGKLDGGESCGGDCGSCGGCGSH